MIHERIALKVANDIYVASFWYIYIGTGIDFAVDSSKNGVRYPRSKGCQIPESKRASSLRQPLYRFDIFFQLFFNGVNLFFGLGVNHGDVGLAKQPALDEVVTALGFGGQNVGIGTDAFIILLGPSGHTTDVFRSLFVEGLNTNEFLYMWVSFTNVIMFTRV
jgi:hypothetical protein